MKRVLALPLLLVSLALAAAAPILEQKTPVISGGVTPTGSATLTNKDLTSTTNKLYAVTAAETAGSVTPSSYFYAPGRMERYGGDPTGVADSTAAFASALAQANRAGGAVIDFSGGAKWKGNFVVTGKGVTIRTAGMGSLAGGNTQFVAQNTALPIWSVGDGSTATLNITFKGGLQIVPAVSTDQCFLVNGVQHLEIDGLFVSGCNYYGLKVTGTAAQPTAFVFVNNYYIVPNTTVGSVGFSIDQGTGGGSYATAVYFDQGHFASSNASNNLTFTGALTGATSGTLTAAVPVGVYPVTFSGSATVTAVAITGTAGQFSCSCTGLAIGMQVAISGTYGGTGSITNYANPTNYIVSATDGTSTFTLLNQSGAAIVTTAGTPTGLTYTASAAIRDVVVGTHGGGAAAGEGIAGYYGTSTVADWSADPRGAVTASTAATTTGTWAVAINLGSIVGISNSYLQPRSYGGIVFTAPTTTNPGYINCTNFNMDSPGPSYVNLDILGNASLATMNGSCVINNKASIYGVVSSTQLPENAQYSYHTAFDTPIFKGQLCLGRFGGDVFTSWLPGFCIRDTGDFNLALGKLALNSVTTGINNVALGYHALTTLQTAAENVAIGTLALAADTSGVDNTAVGYNALSVNQGGSNDIAIGSGSAVLLNGANRNTVVGTTALAANVTSHNNSCLGYECLLAATGASNTTLGYLAGDTIVGGANNITIGASAGSTASGNITGNSDVLIGPSANCIPTSTSTSDEVDLCTSSTFLMRITGGATPSTSTAKFAGGVLSIAPTIGVGYAAGAGGAVTQITSRTTGVTLSKTTGAITLFSAAGSATAATFTVTNTTVAATDTIVLGQQSGTNLYELFVTAVAAGSFNITFFTTGGTATDSPVINFAVIKAAAS